MQLVLIEDDITVINLDETFDTLASASQNKASRPAISYATVRMKGQHLRYINMKKLLYPESHMY